MWEERHPWESVEESEGFTAETQKVPGGTLYKYRIRDSNNHSMCFVPDTEIARVVPIDVKIHPKVNLQANCVIEPTIIPSIEVAAPTISVESPNVTVKPVISVPVTVEPKIDVPVTIESMQPTFHLSPTFELHPTFEVSLIVPPTLPQRFVAWVKGTIKRRGYDV